MRVGMLGTGTVGDALASKLVTLGYDVMMGAREPGNPKASAWVKRVGSRGQAGTFAEAAKFGELVFNCTHGANSLDALRLAGAERLAGKVLVDVANVLPPDEIGFESLAERIQQTFPATKVVKTLNTMFLEIMVDPARVDGSHTVFVSGNDAEAKQLVRSILESFGWKDILDLGDITTARAAEGYLPLWFAVAKVMNTPYFNIKIVR